MEILKTIAKFATENPVVALAALALVAIAFGKGREFADLLTRIQNAADFLHENISPDMAMPVITKQYNGVMSSLTSSTRLTTDQVQGIMQQNAATGKVTVNKTNLALALLRSGDGKKIQRKVRAWFKKI